MYDSRPLVLTSLLLLTAAIASAPLASQADTTRVMIAGTVIDPLRQPIEGAEVRVIGGKLSALTSAAGTFRLFAPRAKEILVQIRRPGYKAQLLKTDGEWSGTVLLEPGAFELPEVQVTARYAKPARYAGTAKYDDYFRRRRIGFGQFINREDIDRRQPQQTAQLLEGRAGIRVSLRQGDEPGGGGGTIISFLRCNEFPPKINVYIDGHKQIPARGIGMSTESPLDFMSRSATRQPDEAELAERREIRGAVGEMLSRVSPGDIELMEIFRGPGELPGEFNDGNCGAIAIWTRQGAR